MRIVKTLFGVVLLLFERLRGSKTVSEIKRPDNSLGSLKGFAVRGYELAIYCQRKEYHVKYDRWYIPDRIEVTYNVFSVVSNDAPKALRKACELDVDLPALVHNWNFDNEIRRAQVHAYLDLLEKRMTKIDATA
jgi:hypothetical protein